MTIDHQTHDDERTFGQYLRSESDPSVIVELHQGVYEKTRSQSPKKRTTDDGESSV